MKTRHRRATRGAALIAVALLGAACSSDDDAATTTAATATTVTASTTAASTAATTADTEATDATDSDTTDASDTTVADSVATDTTDAESSAGDTAGFPMSIPNKFGTTEIEAQPERIVSIGYTDGDDVLALGVTPVAIRDWYGDQPGALWPWAVDAATGEDIEVLSSDTLDFEAIAALDPDLIIGISSEIEQSDYDTLSDIAPVLAGPEGSIQFGTPWDVQQQLIGEALGLDEEAEALIDDVKAQLADAADPAWEGLTGNVAAINADGSSFFYTDGDARGQFVTGLGFTIPEEITTLAGDLFYAAASAEQSTLLDGDLLIYTTFSEEDKAAVQASPLFTALGVVADGHSIYVDETTNAAMSFSTTLSLPYAIDAIVPQISAALGGGAGTGESAGGIVPGEDPEVDDVVTAYATVFDSATTYEEKAPFLAAAVELKATVDSYEAAGAAVNGIQLAPTAVTITGDTAAITYDVLFAGTAVYNDLTGSAVKVDGAWTVTKEEFCGFMSQARNPCP